MTMKNARISFFTNISKTQIIDNGDYFELRGVPVTKDDAVMNGLHYPKDENNAGMPSLIDRVVTLSHPTNKAGDGADAYEGDCLMEFFSGGVVKNCYCDNGVHKVDVRIKKKLLNAQDEANGTDFYKRLENKLDIGVSTGLYCMVEEKIGTNSEGKEYSGIAREQKYNHLAMLPQNEPPAGGDDTYMRFNSDETVERMVVNLADYINDEQNDSSVGLTINELSELMKNQEFAKSVESMLKENVDYMPEASYKRVDEEADDKEECEQKSDIGMLLKLLQIIGLSKLFANKKQATYNNGNDDSKTNGDHNMADMKKMKAALQEAGKLKDEMTDEEVKNAYDKMVATNSDESGFAAQLKAMESRLNALEDENKSLKAQINSENEAEKTKLVNDLESADIGLEKTDLEAMEVNSLKKLHNKHCLETNSLGKFAPKANSSNFDDMPEMEVR